MDDEQDDSFDEETLLDETTKKVNKRLEEVKKRVYIHTKEVKNCMHSGMIYWASEDERNTVMSPMMYCKFCGKTINVVFKE
jgi:hypothetical protein